MAGSETSAAGTCRMPSSRTMIASRPAAGTPAKTNFFWIPDLGFPRYTEGIAWISESFNAGDYATLAAYLVLPILLVVTQFVMQKWMTPSTGGGDQANMTKQIGLMMTFMFGFFTLQVPAGLSLYWVTSNLLQVLQQWLITSDRLKLSGAGAAAGSNASVTIDGSVVDAAAHVNGSSATDNVTDTQSSKSNSNKSNSNKSKSSSRTNRSKRRKAKKRR